MGIQLGVVMPDLTDPRLRLAKQMGAEGIITGVPREGYRDGVWEFQGWVQLRKRIEDAGLKLMVCEGIPIPDRVKLGQPGRDEDIEKFSRSLRAMGQAGIPILCYNWMAVFNWLRTSVTVRVRGGAQATGYTHAEMERGGLTEAGVVTEEQLWESLEYFLRAVIPVAEEVNVQLAMHPDDPPLSPVRGVARIMSKPADFQRMIDLVPSPVNGITFCQGCFAEMGVDIPATIRQFAGQDKLFFAHFRNVAGTAECFHETFHDEGGTDMVEAMRTYLEVGFNGPMRPDHVPTMEGDTDGHPGYMMMGRIYAMGYIRGLIETLTKSGAGARPA